MHRKNVVTERRKFCTINVNNQIFYEKEIKKKAGYVLFILNKNNTYPCHLSDGYYTWITGDDSSSKPICRTMEEGLTR